MGSTKAESIGSVVADNLTPERGKFGDYVAARIRRGIAAGLILLDESGLAVEKNPYAVNVANLPPNASFEAQMTRVEEHQKALRQAGLLEVARAAGEEVEDLRYMLRSGHAQEVALVALEVPLSDVSL